MNHKSLRASAEPSLALDKIAYEGQPAHMKMYHAGYESFFNALPVIEGKGDLVTTQEVIQSLSNALKKDVAVMAENLPLNGEFNRTIIGLEDPKKEGCVYTAGSELVVAKWGAGFASPIHGHAAGYMHEEILSGKMRVNSYRIVDMVNRIVRPLETQIVKEGVFVSGDSPKGEIERQALVHNFVALEPSISLHYLPEHTRDGRDNGFTLEQFSDNHTLTKDDVTRITSKDGMYLKKGEVVLVRSTNVPEYGDHFIVVTGHPIMKEHGLRVQDRSIMASAKDTAFLDEHQLTMGLTLLKLNPEMTEKFLSFHGITMENGEVCFPKHV